MRSLTKYADLRCSISPSVDSRLARALISVVLGAAIAVPMAMVGRAPASALPPRPHLSESIYITSQNTHTIYNEGCNNGTSDKNDSNVSREDILDFGGQNNGAYGTVSVNDTTPFTNSQIETLSELYALGYVGCAGPNQEIKLAIATNNSLDSISSNGGNKWGNVVDTVANSSNGQAVASYVTFEGGNDIEDWASDSQSSDVAQWAQGYNSSTSRYYLNFGSASGCQETVITTQSCMGNSNGFTQSSYWYLSWGNSAAISGPEIYYAKNGQQWLQICLYGYSRSSAILFDGPMNDIDNDSASLTVNQGWDDFLGDLSGTSCAQTPEYEIAQE